MVGLNLSNLNRAIKSGAEKGDFNLKKGASGKITLPPKNKSSSASKEVRSTPYSYCFMFLLLFRTQSL